MRGRLRCWGGRLLNGEAGLEARRRQHRDGADSDAIGFRADRSSALDRPRLATYPCSLYALGLDLPTNAVRTDTSCTNPS